MVATKKRECIRARPNEIAAIEQVSALIGEGADQGHLRLVGSDGQSIELPKALQDVLLAAIPGLIAETSVMILPETEELTTQQAADLLNMSRQYLVRLLERGEIPFHKVGTHHRIMLRDALAYRNRRRSKQREALARMAQFSYDEGMYEEDPDSGK